MRLVPEIQTTNLLALTSELFGKSKIINLPEKAEYSFQDTLNVLLHAATSTTNSIESVLIKGYKLLCDVTVENFMTSMWKFMENRTKDCERLRVT